MIKFNLFNFNKNNIFTLFNNKQKIIVLLIIILFLLNKINIKKNGMNGGDSLDVERSVQGLQTSADYREEQAGIERFNKYMRDFEGWNPLNWGWVWFLPFAMFCFLIYAYIATEGNSALDPPLRPNSSVVPDIDNLGTNVAILDTSRRSPLFNRIQSSSPGPESGSYNRS